MKSKILNLLLIVTSLFGYLEWGGNNSILLFQAEADIISKLFTDPTSVIHPFILSSWRGVRSISLGISKGWCLSHVSENSRNVSQAFPVCAAGCKQCICVLPAILKQSPECLQLWQRFLFRVGFLLFMPITLVFLAENIPAVVYPVRSLFW